MSGKRIEVSTPCGARRSCTDTRRLQLDGPRRCTMTAQGAKHQAPDTLEHMRHVNCDAVHLYGMWLANVRRPWLCGSYLPRCEWLVSIPRAQRIAAAKRSQRTSRNRHVAIPLIAASTGADNVDALDLSVWLSVRLINNAVSATTESTRSKM